MINSGFANNCGIELFTIGWVPCDKGGSPASYEYITPGVVGKREKQIREEDEIAAMIAMAFVEMNER